MKIEQIKFLLFFNIIFFSTNSTNNNFYISDNNKSDDESDSDNVSDQSIIMNELTIKDELLEHFFNNHMAIDLIYECEETFFDGKNLEELVDEVIEKLEKLEEFKKLEILRELEKSKKINNLDFKKFIKLKLKENSCEFISLLINTKKSELVQRDELLENLFSSMILLFNKSIMNEKFYILIKEIFNFLLEYIKEKKNFIFNQNLFYYQYENINDKSELIYYLNNTIVFYKNLIKFSEISLEYNHLECDKINMKLLDETLIYFEENTEIIKSFLDTPDIEIIIKNKEPKEDIYLK